MSAVHPSFLPFCLFFFLVVGLDILFGEMSSRLHPVRLMGALARRSENLMRRIAGDGFWSGALATLLVAAPFLSITCILLLSASLLNLYAMLAVSAICVYLCLAPRSLAEHARDVFLPLNRGETEAAREAVSRIVGRDTAALDEQGIARACIESVSENLTDGVLSTLFWACVGWLVAGCAGAALGAVMHRCFNILDALWGKKNDKYRSFGTFAARTDDVLNFIPARLSLPFIALAACLVRGASFWGALQIGWKYRKAHASPNSPWSEAAFAGALGLKLGGPVSYGGAPAPYPFIGEGRGEAVPADIGRSVRLMWVTVLLFTTLCTLAVMTFNPGGSSPLGVAILPPL